MPHCIRFSHPKALVLCAIFALACLPLLSKQTAIPEKSYTQIRFAAAVQYLGYVWCHAAIMMQTFFDYVPTPGPWFVLFLGPSKMRMTQKTHQLKQYKTRGHAGPFGVAIK